MRFLCPKCKAKYQIADEKLEGRAVRMKCRKCGHVIEVPSPTKKSGTASHSVEAPSAPAPKTISAQTLGLQDGTRLDRGPQLLLGRRLSVPHAPHRRSAPVAPRRPSQPKAPTPAPGGLASAFSQKVREPQHSDVSAAIEVLSAGASEEWYVGVNGVPLGPVRLSTLRQKAQQGVINEDSLVWREGFEEWLPPAYLPGAGCAGARIA